MFFGKYEVNVTRSFLIMVNCFVSVMGFSVADMSFSLLTLDNKVLAFYCFN